MSEAYIYKADMYCAKCAQAIMAKLDSEGKTNVADENTYDSDNYPKGPYQNGGGEADSYHHCAECEEFLANPLTDVGVENAIGALSMYLSMGHHGRTEIMDQWAEDLREYSLEGSQKSTLDRYLDKRREEK